MKFIAILLLIILPSTALAQTPPIITFPPGEDKIVAIKKGEPAPFDGQLMDTNTAIRWGNWMEQYQLRLKIDAEMHKSSVAIQNKYFEDMIKLERDQYRIVTEDYQLRITELETRLRAPKPWYETQTFSFVMGAATMAGVVALSIWALDATRD